MDSQEPNKVIAFDTLFCTNHIQMLKIILPCLGHQMQKKLAVFIKFLELRYAISFYQSHPYPLCGCASSDNSADLGKLCQELKPFCTESEGKQLEHFFSLYNNIKMTQELAGSMDFLQVLMPDASASSDLPDFDIISLLMNMMTPEQKQMYDLFGGNDHDE